MITAFSIAPSSTPAPTLPPAHLTLELYRSELEKERAVMAAEIAEEQTRTEVSSYCSRRSLLINAKNALELWDGETNPVYMKNGVATKLIKARVIKGKKGKPDRAIPECEMADPFPKWEAKLGITSRVLQIPPSLFHGKKAQSETQRLAELIRGRFRKLRETSCMDWHFRLDWITNLTMRIRIAKLVWWDMASVLKKQNCVLTELVNAPITTAQIIAFTEEEVGFELWRLGWPAYMAADRAFHAQKPQK